MPLYKKKIEKNYTYVIWRLTESLEELQNILHINIPPHIKALKRKKEFICVRILASLLKINIEELRYTENGKPIIDGSKKNISISHTEGYVTILISSQKNIGIDIEKYSERLIKVAKHYLSEEEIKNINTFNSCRNIISINDTFLLHWCAKEAIYKAIPNNVITWNRDIICNINKNNISNDMQFEATAKCYNNTIFTNLFEITKDYCLVISLKKLTNQ